ADLRIFCIRIGILGCPVITNDIAELVCASLKRIQEKTRHFPEYVITLNAFEKYVQLEIFIAEAVIKPVCKIGVWISNYYPVQWIYGAVLVNIDVFDLSIFIQTIFKIAEENSKWISY